MDAFKTFKISDHPDFESTMKDILLGKEIDDYSNETKEMIWDLLSASNLQLIEIIRSKC